MAGISVKKPFFIFYILVAYIFVQFSWWAFHMLDLNGQIHALKIALAESKDDTAGVLQMADQLHGQKIMVLGEGAVFLLLLLIGALITRKAFMKEVELSIRQKNFLMSVSHELKSPLAAIKLNLQTLLRRKLERDKSEQLLSASVKDADRLVGLVDNILIAANIDSGDYPLKHERVNLSGIVNEYVSDLSIHGTRLTEGAIEPGLYVTGDDQAMLSILSNLVENALKYSDKGEPVTVKLASEAGRVRLSVTDRGPGIAPGDEQKIFEKFYRAGNETRRKAKGTGLGLFIAKYLAEKQNGTLSVRRNSAKGSTFEVVFERTDLQTD